MSLLSTLVIIPLLLASLQQQNAVLTSAAMIPVCANSIKVILDNYKVKYKKNVHTTVYEYELQPITLTCSLLISL